MKRGPMFKAHPFLGWLLTPVIVVIMLVGMLGVWGFVRFCDWLDGDKTTW